MTLYTILSKKEGKHWQDMGLLLRTISSVGVRYSLGLIIVLLITIFHYLFAIVHTLFECYLFITNRRRFRENLVRMSLTLQ